MKLTLFYDTETRDEFHANSDGLRPTITERTKYIYSTNSTLIVVFPVHKLIANKV